VPIFAGMGFLTRLVRWLLPVRNVARHAGPHLLEATLGPTACFVTGRALWGVNGALALALLWTAGCMGLRHARGKRSSGLLVIGMTTLVLRTAVSMAMHSERAYLMAPALVTLVMGAVFMVSALTSKPLLGRVVGDLVPASWLDSGNDRLARLCRVGSAAWGVEQIVSSAISIAMIDRMSATTYVVVHQPVSWLIFVVVIGALVPFFWRDLRSIWKSRRLTLKETAPGVPRARGGPRDGSARDHFAPFLPALRPRVDRPVLRPQSSS
jgi:hypothetical protein